MTSPYWGASYGHPHTGAPDPVLPGRNGATLSDLPILGPGPKSVVLKTSDWVKTRVMWLCGRFSIYFSFFYPLLKGDYEICMSDPHKISKFRLEPQRRRGYELVFPCILDKPTLGKRGLRRRKFVFLSIFFFKIIGGWGQQNLLG